MVGLICLLFATPSFALDCDNAMTQTDINLCSIAEAKSVDTKLDKTYQALLAKLDPNEKKVLHAAYEKWLSYRKAQCDFNSLGVDGGSASPMATSACYETLADQYTKVLDQQLNCEEGDLSCVRR